MGKKRSERHHLVSQGYLRAWRFDTNDPRVRAVVLPASEPKPIGIDDLCVKSHWLSLNGLDGERDDILETQLGIFEGSALPILTNVLADGFVQPALRIKIAYLFASFAVRGTTLRAKLQAEGKAVGEQYLLDHPDANEDAIRWEQAQHANGDPARLTSFELIAPHHAAWLASMHWALYRDRRGGFMTADQPVLHVLNAHAGAPETSPDPLTPGSLDAIMVALSPEIVLVASWRAGPDTSVVHAPIGLPAWFNHRLRQQAYAHVIYPPSAAPRISPRVRLPELEIHPSRSRFNAAVEAREATLRLNHPTEMVYVRWVDGGYQQFTTRKPPSASRKWRRRSTR